MSTAPGAKFTLGMLLLVAACSGAKPTLEQVPPSAAIETRAPPPPIPGWLVGAAASCWDASAVTYVPEGHGYFTGKARVRVDPSSRKAYAELVPRDVLPVGAVLVQTVEANSRVVAAYAMRKGTAAWEYALVDERGERDPDRELRCARCHAEATADSLFGLPKDPDREDADSTNGTKPAREPGPCGLVVPSARQSQAHPANESSLPKGR